MLSSPTNFDSPDDCVEMLPLSAASPLVLLVRLLTGIEDYDYAILIELSYKKRKMIELIMAFSQK